MRIPISSVVAKKSLQLNLHAVQRIVNSRIDTVDRTLSIKKEFAHFI